MQIQKKVLPKRHFEWKDTAKTYSLRCSRHIARFPHRSDQQLICSQYMLINHPVILRGLRRNILLPEKFNTCGEPWLFPYILWFTQVVKLNHVQMNVKFENNNYKTEWKTKQRMKKLIYKEKIRTLQAETFYLVHLNVQTYFL